MLVGGALKYKFLGGQRRLVLFGIKRIAWRWPQSAHGLRERQTVQDKGLGLLLG